ncbi:MAG: efflux RND transporter periplasmic adaptor subunit [Desulforhopalus sp.]
MQRQQPEKSAGPPDTFPAPSGKNNNLVPVVFQLLLSIAVLGGSIALAAYYLKTGPEAKPRSRKPSPPLVEVTPLKYGSHQLNIESMGTIQAAREITLSPGVGGEIVSISDNLVPGGFFSKDELLATIDPIDYKLAVMQLQAEVSKVENELELEMGNQRIAVKEYEILNQQVSETEKRLMLRQPQLETMKALLQSEKAKLNRAELDLQRTEVRAPFNGVVLSRSVNLGSRVTASTEIARLVDTDEFWLKLAIPVSQLKWISFPGNGANQGSRVKIFSQKATSEGVRYGRVLRLAADLESQGRLASVYVAVKDPLSLLPENKTLPRLLLGTFVRGEVEGIELSHVITVNREHLRDNDTLWLMGNDDTLEIRPVEIIAKTREQVFITAGVREGEKLISSGLPAPVPGTLLQLSTGSGDDTRREIEQ